MSSFAPTLRIVVTPATLEEIAAQGSTLEDVTQQFDTLFRNVDMGAKPTFNAEYITVIETGQILTGFKAQVAAVFDIDGVLHIQTTAGDIIPIKFNLV